MEIFSWATLTTVIDILIVATILYWIMRLIKGTRASKMIWGLGLIALVYFISEKADLLTLNWLLSNFLGSIVILIIVVFQQDIRRALTQMGSSLSSGHRRAATELLEEISSAATLMSKSKTGALIAIEREVDLTGFSGSGVDMDAKVSKELMLSIFNHESPVHDGAVIIRNGRISRAGVILPLTEAEIDKSMGTRHRAALGLSSETDAVLIVVSERSGEISVSMAGDIEKKFDYDKLLAKLKGLFIIDGEEKRGLLSWKLDL
ncbi:MAG: diadenylate cyclase CdaA [Thermodesulfobacteriota bacterium]